MSTPDRRARLDREHGVLSIRRQCRLLGLTSC
jgi:putative transposase